MDARLGMIGASEGKPERKCSFLAGIRLRGSAAAPFAATSGEPETKKDTAETFFASNSHVAFRCTFIFVCQPSNALCSASQSTSHPFTAIKLCILRWARQICAAIAAAAAAEYKMLMLIGPSAKMRTTVAADGDISIKSGRFGRNMNSSEF